MLCVCLQVYLFVRDILNKLFPTNLFGTLKNKKMFLKGVRRFIALGRYEKFCVATLMRGIKFRLVGWLKPMANAQRNVFFTKLLSWIFHHVVMGSLKAHFYITDTSLYRNRTFYYRKKLWRCITRKAVKGHLEKGCLKQICKEEAENQLKTGRSLGVAHMRFLPKSSSLRPIVNLGRTYTMGNGTTLAAVNKQLQSLLAVLTAEKDDNRKLLGASTFSSDDTYHKWRAFIMGRQSRDDKRSLYFVKVDIEGCFDSVKQEKLYQIIASLLNKRCDYVVRRYCTILNSNNSLKRSFKRVATPMYKFSPDFVQFVRKIINAKSSENVIFVDQVLHDHENSTDLLKQLKAHLQGNIIMIGNDYYLQTQGISQGSVLSTLLCNFYYGQMEERHLVVLPDEMLVRQVDDFLFVTPYRENALSFLSTMVTGIEEYGCKVNPQKTMTNFEVPSEYCTRVVAPQGLVPWCGMLLNPVTLEARVDYMRYEGMSIQEITTLELSITPGQNMATKLFSSLRSRCDGMFLDPKVNSWPVLIENLFKMFLLAAYKFHSNILCLPSNKRVVKNVAFFKKMIQDLPYQFHKCMKKKVIKGEVDGLDLTMIQCVCAKAFKLKLAQNKSLYHPLLRWLSNVSTEVEKWASLGHICEEIPEDFKGILEK